MDDGLQVLAGIWKLQVILGDCSYTLIAAAGDCSRWW